MGGPESLPHLPPNRSRNAPRASWGPALHPLTPDRWWASRPPARPPSEHRRSSGNREAGTPANLQGPEKALEPSNGASRSGKDFPHLEMMFFSAHGQARPLRLHVCTGGLRGPYLVYREGLRRREAARRRGRSPERHARAHPLGPCLASARAKRSSSAGAQGAGGRAGDQSLHTQDTHTCTQTHSPTKPAAPWQPRD